MLLQRAGADLAEGIDALKGTEEAFRHRVPSPTREANKLEERETGKANESLREDGQSVVEGHRGGGGRR